MMKTELSSTIYKLILDIKNAGEMDEFLNNDNEFNQN